MRVKRGRRECKGCVARVVDRIEAFSLGIVSMPVWTCVGSVLWHGHAKLRCGFFAWSNGRKLAGSCRSLPACGHVQVDFVNRNLLITRISDPNGDTEDLPGNGHERFLRIRSNCGINADGHTQPKSKIRSILELLALEPEISEQFPLFDGSKLLLIDQPYNQSVHIS